MYKFQPLTDPATRYRIEVRGQVEIDWLQSFINSAEIVLDQTKPVDKITVIHVQTDQSGVVGLLRRLHGLGVAILKLQIVSR